MIDLLLTSVIATNAPRISPSTTVNRPASSSSTPAPTLPSVPVVYPNRNNSPSPSSTTQPSTKSWADKVWERYQNRQRSLP
jgi:hypothetical protein